MKNYIGNWLALPIILIYATILKADDSVLATITVKENAGYSRDLEYVECTIQVSKKNLDHLPPKFITEDISSELQISCQIIEMDHESSHDEAFYRIVFPLSIGKTGTNIYHLKQVNSAIPIKSDLNIKGSGFDIIVENHFYRADLSKNESSGATKLRIWTNSGVADQNGC